MNTEALMNEGSLMRISTKELERGMYISQLDRPWLETPFLIQGFFVRDEDDINELERHCSFVLIDPSKGRKPQLFGASQPIDERR